MAALTAWQPLFDYAKLSAGQKVLIYGAAGGVGSFAVQLSHWATAHVIGVDASRNSDLLSQLGCDEVVDFTTTRFEDVVHDTDVILDAVEVGDAIDRSWDVLKKGGTLILLAKPLAQEKVTSYGINAVFFVDSH